MGIGDWGLGIGDWGLGGGAQAPNPKPQTPSPHTQKIVKFLYEIFFKKKNIILILFLYIFFGVWGLGFGVWGFGFWAQTPIPNPQSPIPIILLNFIKYIILLKTKQIHKIN